MIVRSFPPVAAPDATTLILGSMPGKVSLAAQQYYAYPQNLFWRIMGELFGAKPELPYEQRLEILKRSGVALWDVLQECYRESALDADIIETSIVANDFAGFFARHTNIRRVFFNGTKAEQAFRRHVLPTLGDMEKMEFARLPSTSPANASIPINDRITQWQQAMKR
ncbi:MAG: DNA-deoxyinosine glycosylase [Methylobacillus sp.]|jgi:TDG/mug DNA glycosylase family protein|nr:DNA-deoxyinosine glycosylase [Methylobacillus sp.]